MTTRVLLRYILLLSSLVLSGFDGRTQTPKPLLKIGAFPYLRHAGVSGFSAHFELEKAWKNKEFITSGPRLDYVDIRNFRPNFYLGYQLKFYPFYWHYERPYQGIFIGIDPFYLMKNPGDGLSRYGPGLGGLLGYQHVFNNRISVSFEGSVVYFQNLNNNVYRNNPEDRYQTTFANIKVGVRLGKSTRLQAK